MGTRRISLTAGRRPTVATIRRGSERKVPHTGTDQTPTGGSSEEYWSMAERLNQPSSVQDDGPTGCKLLLREDKGRHVWRFAGIP